MTSEMPSIDSLEDKMKKYAVFAKAAYGSDNSGHNYQKIAGYHIDNRFTNENRVLYASDTDPNEAVYSFRGTDVKNVHDIGTDVLNTVGLNAFSARQQNSIRAAKGAAAQYSNLTLSGHSAGGFEALAASKAIGDDKVKTVVFSPHVNYWQGLESNVTGLATKFHNFFFPPKAPIQSNTYIYKTSTDVVTAYINSTYRNAHISTVKELTPLNPHSMENFMGTPS
jgi:hypothetical protein